MSQSAQHDKSWSKWHMRLQKRLKQNKSLLPSGASILLAISGGQDSMSLLRLIIDLQRLYQWKIEVWHGDHQWHSKSEKIQKELKAWCVQNKISFHSNQANKEEVANEQKARDWRYKQLIKQAKLLTSANPNFPCTKILTGHTATDRAETIIMNLARGTDLAGLSSLKEKRTLENNLELIRPLLIFNREETLEICERFNLPIWIDPSNENLNLTRNKIRQEILPILNSIHKGADSRISSLAKRLESYNEDQTFFAKIALEICKAEQINSLSRTKVINYPNSIRQIIITNWLKMIGVKRITTLQIEEINAKISDKKPAGTINLHGGFVLKWNKEIICIAKNIN